MDVLLGSVSRWLKAMRQLRPPLEAARWVTVEVALA
jgi:hypothetical protein